MAAPNVPFYVHRDLEAVLKILEMLIVLVAYIHIISCMWFAFVTVPAPNQNTWARAINLDQEPIAHKYTISFHFIWTCLINTSHDVLLLNTFERVCTLFVWIRWDSSFFHYLWVQWHRTLFNSKNFVETEYDRSSAQAVCEREEERFLSLTSQTVDEWIIVIIIFIIIIMILV